MSTLRPLSVTVSTGLAAYAVVGGQSTGARIPVRVSGAVTHCRRLDALGYGVIGCFPCSRQLKDDTGLLRVFASVFAQRAEHDFVVCALQHGRSHDSRCFLLLESHIDGVTAIFFDSEADMRNHLLFDDIDHPVARGAQVPLQFADAPRSMAIPLQMASSWAPYNLLINNCQHFASALWNALIHGEGHSPAPATRPSLLGALGQLGNIVFSGVAGTRN